MRVYLAGPMRGVPHFNFPAFHAAAAELRARGYVVFSPAEADNDRHGADISAGNLAGSAALELPPSWQPPARWGCVRYT